VSKVKPTYLDLVKRLAVAEPIVEALKHQEVDAVVGEEKIAFLLLRKVEEAWLESHGEFAAMFNLGGIGMIQADAPAFRFTRVNPKFCEISGYSAEELLTRTYIGFTHQNDRKRGLKTLARVIRGKIDSWSIEKRCTRKNGSTVWVSVHGFALRDQAGRAVRIVAMVEDVTARKQAEQQKRDAQVHMNKQLLERTAELSQMLRPLGDQVAKRKLTEHVLRAIQEFIDRCIGSVGARSSSGANRRKPRKSTSSKKTEKYTGRKSSRKSRPRAR
jgi:PAS domain S-box-containing protein